MYIDSMVIEDFNRRANGFKEIEKKHKQQMKKIGYPNSSMARYIKQEERVNKDITPKHLWFRRSKWRRKAKIYNANLERIREGKRTRIKRRSCKYIRNKLDFYEESMRLLTHLEDIDIALRKKEDNETVERLRNIDNSSVVAKISTMIKLDLSSFDSKKEILDKLNHLSKDSFDKLNKFIREYNDGIENEGEKISTLTKESIANDLSKIYIDAIDSVDTKHDKETNKNRENRRKKIEEIKKQLVPVEKEIKAFLERKDKFIGDTLLFDDFQKIEKRFRSIYRSHDIEEDLLSKCLEEDVNSIADPDEKKEKIEGLFNDYISNSETYKAEEGDDSIFASIWKNILKFFGLSSDEKMPDSINESINDKLERAVGGTPRTKDADEKNTPEQNAGRTNPALTLHDPKRPDVELSEDSEARKPAKTTTPTSPSHAQEGSSQQQPQNPQSGQQPKNPQSVQQPQNPQLEQQPQNPQSGQQPQNPQSGQQPQNSLLTQLLQQNPLLAQLVEQNPLLMQSLQKNPLLMQLLQQNLQSGQQPQNPLLGQQLQNPLPAQLLQQNLPYVPHVSYQPSLQHYGPCIDLNTYSTLTNLLEQILYKLSAGSINYNHPYASVPVPYSNRVLPTPHQLTFREFLEDKYGTPFPYRNLPFFDPVFLENNNNLALNNSLLLNLIISEKIKSILGNDFPLASLNQASNQLGPDNGFPLASLNQASNQLGPDNGFPLASLNQASNQLGPDNGFPLVDPEVSTGVHRVFNNEAAYSDKETQTNEDTDEINYAVEDIMSFAEEQALKFASKEGEISTETKREIVHNLVERADLSEDLANLIVNSDLINDDRVLDVLMDDNSYDKSKNILTILSSINEDFGKIFSSELSI